MKKTIWVLTLSVIALPVICLIFSAMVPFSPFLIVDLGSAVLKTFAGNTILLSLTSCVLALFIGVSAAWMVSFFSFQGKKTIKVILNLPLIFPPYIVAMVYKEMLHHQPYPLGNLFESLWGCSVIFAFTLYPYVYILTRIAFHNQGKIYIEAGRSLGLNRMQQIKKIVFPMAYPSICLSLLLVFMEVISDYGTVSIMGIRTLTTGIYDVWFSMFNPELAIHLSLLTLMLPMAVLFLYWVSTRNKGVYNPANRPQRTDLHPLQGWAQPVFFTLCLLPPLLGFFLPAGILLKWSFDTLHRVNLNIVFSDIFHTLSLSVVVCLFCIVLGILFSFSNRTNKTTGWIKIMTWLININYAIPGIAIAVSILYLTSPIYQTSTGKWLSDTVFFLIFACIVRYLCFAFFSIESGMKKISLRMDEAAICIGKSRRYALLHIHLPLLKRSLIVGSALVFINMTKELTMTMVLQPFNYSSLAMRVFRYANVDMLKESSVFAICLILISAYPALSLDRWLNDHRKVQP